MIIKTKPLSGCKFVETQNENGSKFVESTTGLQVSITLYSNMKWYLETEGLQFIIEEADAKRIIKFFRRLA